MISVDEKNRSFLYRFYKYQNERFPFIQNGIMITAFTFSAASFSRICRHEDGFMSLTLFFVGVITSFIFFFLLRIFDEFKDNKKDCKYQPYRAVPRGLISLKELGWVAFFLIVLQITLNTLFMPIMLYVYVLVMGYMILMTKEFFVKEWLTTKPITYMWSHMLIMPLIDFYTTGLDWLNASADPPTGLIYFLAVTFFNGIIIEVGRKIRAVDAEEAGVDTYSSLFGSTKATLIWVLILVITFCFAVQASFLAGYGWIGFNILLMIGLVCVLPAIRFIKTKKQEHAKQIEFAAAIWTICMYLTLGGVPMLLSLF